MPAEKTPASAKKARVSRDPWSELNRPAAPAGAQPSEPGQRNAAAISIPAPAPDPIEQLPPSKIIPDPYQPRHPLLPEEIRLRFQNREVTCYQAAREWLDLAAPAGEDRNLQDLLEMGVTLEDGGQINPLTGYYQLEEQSGEYLFHIVTGERRFWATVLHFVQLLPADQPSFQEPLVRVTCTAKPSPVQQVVENRHSLIPSAVGQARGIAALVLYFLGERPPYPPEADTYAYFRNALRIHKPDGLWEQIIPFTRLKTRRMQALLNILNFPTPLLDLADEYRISSRTIEAILANPAEEWPRLVSIAVKSIQDRTRSTSEEDEEKLEAEEVNPRLPKTVVPVRHLMASELATRGIRRFQKAAFGKWRQQPEILDTVADQIFMDQTTQEMIEMLSELIQRLEARRNANP